MAHISRGWPIRPSFGRVGLFVTTTDVSSVGEARPPSFAVRRPFGVRAVALPGLAPWQAPQSAHREDDGEERGHAERQERPDEKKAPLELAMRLPTPTPFPII